MIKAWRAFRAARTARRQEKSRRSQQIESTFAERLASRSSKIDVGYTASQPNLNSQEDEGRRRTTFSRFIQLWKGSRNSKRKSNNEETRTSVVFTIPTEDIFPKSQPKQHTQERLHSDNVVHMDYGFVTHMCVVHRGNENHDSTKNDLNHQLHVDHVSKNSQTEQPSNHELNEAVTLSDTAVNVEVGTRNREKENELCSSSSDNMTEFDATKETASPSPRDASAWDGNGETLTDDDTSASKECDVEKDSGCGSSIHEMSCVESSTGLVCLSFKSLNVTSRNERCVTNNDKRSNRSEHSLKKQTLADLAEGTSCLDVTENDARKEIKNSNAEEDSFQTLIQLAKEGMSQTALEACDRNAETNINTSTIQSSNSDDNTATGESSSEMNSSVDDTESALFCNTHKIDSGVHISSTNSLWIEKRSIKDSKSSVLSNEAASNGSSRRVLANGTIPSDGAAKEIKSSYSKSKTGEFQVRKLKRRKQKQVSFESLPKDASKETLTLTCDKTSEFFQETEVIIKVERKEAFLSVESLTGETDKGYPLDDLENGANKTSDGRKTEDKKTKPTGPVPVAKLCSLKVTSLETLNLSSHESTSHKDNRARSFSATIRRKLSFRSRHTSDDIDVESGSPERETAKSKQMKTFRSFRENKKTKSCLNDTPIWDFESSEANGYCPTYERIFSAKTDETVFSNLPFTIPELYD